MGRMTLRLPETLHRQVEVQANMEGVSLNQYIVFALTRQITLDYTVQSVPERAISEQRVHYNALLHGLGQTTFPEVQRALNEREQLEPEIGLTPDVIERLRERMARREQG